MLCGPLYPLKSTKELIMTYVQWGGILVVYSSGTKTRKKHENDPMETTLDFKMFRYLFKSLLSFWRFFLQMSLCRILHHDIRLKNMC